jgi:hypothetical protein
MKNIVLAFILFMAVAAHARANNGHVKNSQGDTTDTLNILFSTTSHIYYYTVPMAEDGSNFKSINANNIRDILFLGSQEAKEKNHSLIVMLKIQDEKSLNESSKKAIVYVKEHSNYGQSKLSELEKQLILVTEKANIDN